MKEQTLLLGNGPAALGLSAALRALNIPVLRITPEPESAGAAQAASPLLEVRTRTCVSRCSGTDGCFHVTLTDPAGSVTRTFSRILIAEEASQIPQFSLYGLSPCPSVLSLSQFRQSPEAAATLSAGQTAVFIVGLAGESHPHLLEAAMEACLKLQTEAGVRTAILTGNLKVGAAGLEAMFRKTRDAGVMYVKFSDARPDFRQDADGRVHITFTDDVTRLPFTLVSDLTVVDDAFSPPARLEDLSRIFNLDRDAAGFLQADNVHRLCGFTNRKGILAIGPSRGLFSESALEAEIRDAAATVLALARGTLTSDAPKARIDPGLCVRCLTCYRLCPYGAITLDTRPLVASDACEGCGICAAECPEKAIDIQGLNSADVADRLQPRPAASGGGAPFLAAFCCSRSAVRARELAAISGLDMPKNMTVIEVPCAGGISLEHLLAAFRRDADGVMVFTCHEGNCHSERGNILAAQRAAHLKQMMADIGIHPDRLRVKTLAANMAAELAETACEFEKTIAAAGPLRPVRTT